MNKIKIGGIEAFVEEADQYLQLNDICDADLRRIAGKITNKYKKYDKWFCYHNTEIPHNLLIELGAEIADDSVEMRLNINNFNDSSTLGVVRVTNENFDEFAACHNERNPQMYWTSERLRRDLSRWGIFMLRTDNRITGYLLLSLWDPAQAEIFCVEANDSIQCKCLIAFAARFAFENNKNEVLYMADENTNSHAAALSVGFAVTGFYKGYHLK